MVGLVRGVWVEKGGYGVLVKCYRHLECLFNYCGLGKIVHPPKPT